MNNPLSPSQFSCHVQIHLIGKPENIKAVNDQIEGQFGVHLNGLQGKPRIDLDKVVPIPESVAAKGFLHISHWCAVNWGTMLPAYAPPCKEDTDDTSEFHTVGNPPIAAFLRLSDQHPEVLFEMFYTTDGFPPDQCTIKKGEITPPEYHGFIDMIKRMADNFYRNKVETQK